MSEDASDSWSAIAYDFGLDLALLAWIQQVMRSRHDRSDDLGLAAALSRATVGAPDHAAEFIRRAKVLQLPGI
jgi:hypothetical protein